MTMANSGSLLQQRLPGAAHELQVMSCHLCNLETSRLPWAAHELQVVCCHLCNLETPPVSSR